ncbi:Exopolysaccharide biosynthesis protein [Thermosinus carboxydivorans Nor1]|uniref:Exopolysaccharide biosynthesis protein n=1 Tax=Thermosinus carboxydivorans Nor1 TaxID=401526 RepID=A1HRE9_9FIRM|nr:phosphodiester glycosidase family protein [Thermosinus carboxydivorans]EAX47464.1 Exopolysaccharide biosynthesis protein [Thermosinus carboxydivorans Nor1]
MNKRRITAITLAFLLLWASLAWAAAPATAPTGAPAAESAAAPAAVVSKVRSSQAADKVRIVLDMTAVPAYKVRLLDEPLRLVVDLEGAVNKSDLTELKFNDPLVGAARLAQAEPGKLRLTIDLKQAVIYNVFSLKAPNRLVIDLVKVYEQKVTQEVMPGLTYTSWLSGRPYGPVSAHILTIDLKQGFVLKPVLANGVVQGLDTVSAMARACRAVAAVNGSYFAPTGEILGLLKLDGEIVSTPPLARTAMGIMPDGKIIMDQVTYQGYVQLPSGDRLSLDGVNRERGVDEIILYSSRYGVTTGTNIYGIEYVIAGDEVKAVKTNDSVIPADGFVLSAHGRQAQALAGLKVGDKVKIHQSLGPVWDKTVHALGAGPMLLKNGSIYLTTKIEEFGSDVAGGRAPRTALGLTKDGRVLLVVVDGRQPTSAGMTLLELALFLQELGAVDAMNLDGGGSSEMVINDKVVNKPSDGRERKVGSALAVISARLAI